MYYASMNETGTNTEKAETSYSNNTVKMLNAGEETVPAGTLTGVSDENVKHDEGKLDTLQDGGSLISIISAGRSLGTEATRVSTSAGTPTAIVSSFDRDP
jgi:hypothetical protein